MRIPFQIGPCFLVLADKNGKQGWRQEFRLMVRFPPASSGQSDSRNAMRSSRSWGASGSVLPGK